jgi:hypothetical protein
MPYDREYDGKGVWRKSDAEKIDIEWYKKQIDQYFTFPRLAIFENGDQVKYDFFEMSSKGEWIVRTRCTYRDTMMGRLWDYTCPYKPPPPKKHFEIINGMKKYPGECFCNISNEKTEWNRKWSEEHPLTYEELYEQMKIKYETIFNWLCISFNRKEIFWR